MTVLEVKNALTRHTSSGVIDVWALTDEQIVYLLKAPHASANRKQIYLAW